ncbi:TPA: hypothetical protein ACHLB2_002179, partial [Escherichia coli]
SLWSWLATCLSGSRCQFLLTHRITVLCHFESHTSLPLTFYFSPPSSTTFSPELTTLALTGKSYAGFLVTRVNQG